MKFWLMQRTWVRTKITVGVVTAVLPLELCAVMPVPRHALEFRVW